MVRFTSILFASLAALSSVSAIPTPTPPPDDLIVPDWVKDILNLGPMLPGNMTKRLNLGEFVQRLRCYRACHL